MTDVAFNSMPSFPAAYNRQRGFPCTPPAPSFGPSREETQRSSRPAAAVVHGGCSGDHHAALI